MTSLLDDLRIAGGESRCDLFENAATGVQRGVFWSFRIDFEEVVFDDESWLASLEVEWLTWQLRDWKELGRCTLTNVERPELVESSVYLGGRHQSFQLSELSLEYLGKAEFLLRVLGIFSLVTPDDRQHGPARHAFQAKLPFLGAIVVPSNLAPKPSKDVEATRALNAFLDTATFEPPRWDKFRFVFSPKDAA